ncbi:MAG: hypothetical protein IT323_09245 [Anaerolineae bacterium]|nr:hypothetical protein [Anaerolineae bacterium]
MFNKSVLADTPIDDEIRDYVRQNFKRAKQKRRLILFIVNFALVAFLILLAWAIALADREWQAAAILMTVATGLAVMFHGISAYSESEHGDREIKRSLVLEARIKRAIGGLDSSLDDIDVSDAPEARAKRKRAHLALPEDEEIDLEALGRPDAEQDRRSL